MKIEGTPTRIGRIVGMDEARMAAYNLGLCRGHMRLLYKFREDLEDDTPKIFRESLAGQLRYWRHVRRSCLAQLRDMPVE